MNPQSLKPAGYDKHGPYWVKEDVDAHAAGQTNAGDQIKRRSKTVSTDYAAAVEVMASARKMFSVELDALVAAQANLSSSAKATSTSVRKAANEIHEGLQRIEKAANFDRLERQVAVLERAAAALTALAELEKDGRLARLISAVKP